MDLEDVSPMLNLLQTLNVLLVTVAMGLALAHALELPGKPRRAQDGSTHTSRACLGLVSLATLVVAST